MTDAIQAVEPPQTNGIDSMDDEERAKIRPADIDADVKEMERRKRVEHIMNSKMFREELERIIETQLNEGTGTNSLMQQISDMMGVNKQAGNLYKNSSCVLPINDIRGIEAMSYGKGEKILRCKLAAVYRLIDLCGWNQGTASFITARLNQDEEHFLVNPYGMLYHEITASSLIKVDMQANIVEQGTTNFSVNISSFSLHGAIHAARPDIKCIIHLHTPSVVAVSATKAGILPISQESVVIGEVSTHPFLGGLIDPEEKDKLARNLGPNNKVLLLTNQGVLCCGETIEEAFFNARNTVLACEAQLKLLPIGLDNIILLNEETRKRIYEAAHKAPESTPRPDKPSILEGKVERKWRVGGIEFEGLMRMLDNVGFRTGYIYRHPLVKGDIPRPKNDVEVPPAVSSLGYLLEEEELYKKGLWRNLGEGKKGQNRSRWLNSPNVYQRVEFLETGTQDPKKITKWVADGSPTHSSTPVKIENALQFVPKNTNPKEFKLKQQQIKDYRRADKISAGPQSYILDTLTWEEAKKMQDASLNQSGDQVVLMGAASKGIIQRGHQHNAMVYKSPYAKNPFDSVTDEELDEYKKNVEKKVKGDYDTDFSESELSSAAINKRMDSLHLRSPTSETEEESRDEPQVLRIETKQAPRPSQPEVVLSDGSRVLKSQEYIKKMNACHEYRTNSHYGLPRGSYLIPNPVHYHIVRQKLISRLTKPRLTNFSPYNCSSDYLFNHNRPKTKPDPMVTVNFDNSHSVSLNIPVDILKGFILPFANALNVTSIPTLASQASQTTYMNNFQWVQPNVLDLQKNYTPLLVESTSSDESKIVDGTTSFEAEILKKMQDKIQDMSLDSNTTAKDSLDSSGLETLKEFDEHDELESNESFVDISLFLKENFDDFDFTKVQDTFVDESACSKKTVLEASKYQNEVYHIDETLELPFQGISDEDFLEVLNMPKSSSITGDGYDQMPFKEDSGVDHLMLEVLHEIEGSINNLPVSGMNITTSIDTMKPVEKNDRILWRISETSNENECINISNSTYDISDSSDFINDTFIVDCIENDDSKHNTFIISDDDEEQNEQSKNYNNNRANEAAFHDKAVQTTHNDNSNIDSPQEKDVIDEDEGVDLSLPHLKKKSSNPVGYDDKVKKLAEAIYEYLQQQCFEIRELILFPEILHDPSLNKLLAKLKNMYDEFYSKKLTDVEKNELRLTISTYVLSNLENDSSINTDSSNDSSLLNIVSDKIFTITEFVSDILDSFFDIITKSTSFIVKEDGNGENFLEFTKPFRDTNGNLLHSTPESPLEMTPTDKNAQITPATSPKVTPVVTSFKKDKSRKSGAEAFWITCSNSPQMHREMPRTPRRVINVDDIPLRPPEDLISTRYSNINLGIIPEEPRCHSPTAEDEYTFNLNTRLSYQTTEDDLDDILAGGDGSYISFNEPEVNVVLQNEVNFFRICTRNSSSYIKTNSVTLKKQNVTSRDDSNDSFYSVNDGSNNNAEDDEGDWMGYEMAKF